MNDITGLTQPMGRAHPMEVVFGRRAHSRSDVRIRAHDLAQPRHSTLQGARAATQYQLAAFRALTAVVQSTE
jgi:hypothetical protein